jgi:hypothetical protein
MTENPTTPDGPDQPPEDPTITEEVVNGLFTALDSLSLSAAQRALLSAILRVAADVHDEGVAAVDDVSFSEQFAASFTPTQAERVLAYAHGAGVSNPHTDAIHRVLGPLSVTTAAIHRAIHRI